MLFSAVAAFAAVSSVAAHGGVTSYVIGGTTYAGWSPYNDASTQVSIERPYSSYDPILSATAPTIHCNNNGLQSAHQLSATVPAGTVITAKWTQWTHAQGPVMVYMAKCPGSCSSTNTATVNWFKIAETGLKSGTVGNGTWGTGDVLDTLQYTATIPAALADGEYFIRHELLALHQANTPQFYPECGQLIITNGGGQSPTSDFLVKFPGGYSQSDPSININIYSVDAQTQTTYKVPGPPVWPSGSSSSPPSSPSSTSTKPVTSTTKPVTSTSTTTTVVSTTSSAPIATQTKYGQCGGQGYNGPTVCEAGSTCKDVSPPYYSQCQ